MTVLARGGAFAPWAETHVGGLRVRHFPHYPLQPFHHALARSELAGWLREGADGADLLHVHLPLLPPLPTDLPVVATFHSPMLHDTGAIAEPGLRPVLIKANARLFSRRYEQWLSRPRHGGGRGVGRGRARARGLLSAAGPATAAWCRTGSTPDSST